MALEIVEVLISSMVSVSIFLLLYVALTKITYLEKFRDVVEAVSEKLRRSIALTIFSLILGAFALYFINIIHDTSYVGFGLVFAFIFGLWIILFLKERHLLSTIKPYMVLSIVGIFASVYLLGGNLNNIPGFVNKSRDNLPPQIREIAEANRLQLDAIDEKLFVEFYNLLYKFDSFDAEPDVPDYENLEFYNQIPTYKALDDVDYLFGILKYGYAAYEYFGGDEVFLKAKEDIIYQIEKMEGSILRVDLIKILVDNLNFLQDGHFRIDSNQMFQRYNYYTSEDYAFYKNEEGFHTFINGQMFQLSKIGGGNVEDFLMPSINNAGEIVYYLGKLYPSSSRDHRIEIILESDSTVVTEIVVKRIATYTRNTGTGSTYRYSEVSGIPMIQIGSMFPHSESQIRLLSDFVQDARKLRRESHFIIDLRGNGGGSEAYPRQWIQNYSRQMFSADRIVSNLHTSTSMAAFELFAESLVDQEHRMRSLKSIDEIKNNAYYPGWSPIHYDLPRQIRNNNNIFVLIDGGVASAAESFVRMLRQMDNVIFIGENTAGISLVGNNNGFLLPNSVINLNFGQSLYLNLDLTDDEGIGFRPDFWVPAGDSLDRTVKFINNYFIK